MKMRKLFHTVKGFSVLQTVAQNCRLSDKPEPQIVIIAKLLIPRHLAFFT